MIQRCKKCPLEETSYQQIQTGGNCSPEDCELLIVGDYPRSDDDITGYPLSGNQYKFLWELLSQIGVKYQVTYLIRCIPIDKYSRRYRKPEIQEYESCMKNRFEEEIKTLKPKCILALGQSVLDAIICAGYLPKFETKTGNALGDFREMSHTISIQDHTCKFLATYHPSFVLNNENDTFYDRMIEDIVYSCRHAMAHRVDGVYRSMTINAEQYSRIVDIWVNDSKIEYIGFDTESNGLDPLVPGAKITSFSVSADAKTGFNIFLYHPEIDISDRDREKIIEASKRLLTTKKIVAHHAKHEHRFVKVLWGFTPNITDDTMYMSYILFLAQKGISHGLKLLSGRFIALPPWEEKMEAYKRLFAAMKRVKTINDERVFNWINEYSEWLEITPEDIYRFWNIIKDPEYYIRSKDELEKDVFMWLVPAREMEKYAGMDAIAPLLLMNKFKPMIAADPGLSEAYLRMVRCAEAFANIELHGCKLIDPNRWSDLYLSIMDEHLAYLKNHPVVLEYEKETGKEFSPTSPKCMQTILYEKLHFPVLATTGTGNPSCGEPAMIALIKKMQEEYGEDSDDPRIQFLWHLRDYKKMQKIQNTYFIGLQKLIRPRAYDGVHDRWIEPIPDHSGPGDHDIMFTQYLLHGTDSGRASSNFHTIPHRSDIAKALSSLNYENGGVLLQADHSQLELRVLACIVEKYYGDSALANAYREGKDIHRFNAAAVFNKPMEEIVDAERRFAKTISFAICYGSSESSVADSTGRTPQEVHDLFETFYSNFPGVRAYIEDAHKFASQYGCIRTPMGRVRWIDGSLNPENRSLYSRAMRQAQNQLIQSAGSDLSLATIAWFNAFAKTNGLNSQVMCWVHDSITIDATPNEWIYSYYCILYGMKYLNEKRDWVCAPLGVDVDISTNWSDHATISSAQLNKDGSWTFVCKGYDYVIEDVLKEAEHSYRILQNDILESKEFVEDVGDGLIAKKSFNISYDGKTFISQKRKITIAPQGQKELDWCLKKYELEQSGSQDMPGDLYSNTTDLF